MKVNEYKQGDIIFRQGDFSTVFYKLIGGSVGVYVGYGSENEKQLTTLHAGDYLGEMGVIEAYPRSATAVVLEDGTRMEEISDKEIDSYFLDRTGDLFQIMRQLAQRLRDRTNDYEEACRALDELQKTSEEPEKRSKSLLDVIKKMNTFYNYKDIWYY
ncbi:MAG: Crp/Fnr family transcriptional regulator [Oscillospiraceae bacterium]|nr:Crp/Fnr family transcriptional regulator [Oscillospiraceae bacterium]